MMKSLERRRLESLQTIFSLYPIFDIQNHESCLCLHSRLVSFLAAPARALLYRRDPVYHVHVEA